MREIKLLASDDELTRKFSSLSSASDVAELLEIPYKDLIFILYRKGMDSNYKTFTIKKKDNNDRIISAPIGSLKILQEKLLRVLELVYQPKSPVKGFVKGESILTNSQLHVRKKYVLNLDLKDFFPSINFGRVRGRLMKPPYNLPDKPATVIAQICTYNNQLPQGAPTSPIISNMICSRLDRELQRLAKTYFCSYSRYADDITFSTTLRQFPKELAFINSDGNVLLGGPLTNIIENNYFSVNENKVKLQHQCQRQEVTGITVNEFPNTQRKYVRQIRAMLHAWERYGLDKAEKEYIYKYKFKNNGFNFANIVHGKISYLRMIRGEEDEIYRNLSRKFLELAGWGFPIYKDQKQIIFDSIWVLECDETYYQGTGVYINGIGLITCEHVLGSQTRAFKYDDFTNKYPVKLIKQSNDLNIDLALLEIEGIDKPMGLELSAEELPEQGSPVVLTGFPLYKMKNTPYLNDGKVVSIRDKLGQERFFIDVSIVKGNSGGPVLDSNNNVIGIAVTGDDSFQSSDRQEEYGVIPIKVLKRFLYQ